MKIRPPLHGEAWCVFPVSAPQQAPATILPSKNNVVPGIKPKGSANAKQANAGKCWQMLTNAGKCWQMPANASKDKDKEKERIKTKIKTMTMIMTNAALRGAQLSSSHFIMMIPRTRTETFIYR